MLFGDRSSLPLRRKEKRNETPVGTAPMVEPDALLA
jgi:hypothetical protein